MVYSNSNITKKTPGYASVPSLWVLRLRHALLRAVFFCNEAPLSIFTGLAGFRLKQNITFNILGHTRPVSTKVEHTIQYKKVLYNFYSVEHVEDNSVNILL